MKNKLIKIFSILFTITLITTTFAATPSEVSTGWPYFDGELECNAAYVIDADSSVTLFSYNPDKKLYPASLAKLMTAIIVLEKSKDNLDDLVTFSYNAVTKDIDRNSVTIGASAGDQLSIKDCLYSLLLPSANDAANALAEHIAGSITDFVKLMNEKCENLGLTGTHFVNPSGLHDDNQYTTAHDMAIIMKTAMQYPIFLEISSSVSYRHAPIRRYKNPDNSNNQVLNTNSIMVPGSGMYYNGVTAGKTGHTNLAGNNLAVSAKKNNMHLITIILGGKTDKSRFKDAKKLFDFHFNNYISLRIKDIDDRFKDDLGKMSINNVGLVNTLDISSDESSHITIPKGISLDKVKSNLYFQTTDIYNKYAVGTVDYFLNNKLIGRCSLEGKDKSGNEKIFTGHLDLSRPLNENTVTNENQTTTKKTNALIYRSENGILNVSNTLIVAFVVAFAIVVFIITFIFLYERVFTNINFPLTKIIFKIRRKFKH